MNAKYNAKGQVIIFDDEDNELQTLDREQAIRLASSLLKAVTYIEPSLYDAGEIVKSSRATMTLSGNYKFEFSYPVKKGQIFRPMAELIASGRAGMICGEEKTLTDYFFIEKVRKDHVMGTDIWVAFARKATREEINSLYTE